MKRIMLMMAVGWMSVPVHAGFRAAPMARSSRAAGMPFAAELSLGLANGKAKEHVYDYDGPGGARRQLSRLDWDIKNVVMGGGSLSARLMDKLTVNAGLWLALSKGGGEMEDYDWLGPVYGVPAELNTHYSLSDVDVTAGYILDLNVAWDLVQRNGLVARVMAGYKQNGWTWEDRIRYMVYIDDYFIPDYSYAGDNGINYEQEFRIPYLGASADWMWNQFTFSGYLTWSPIVEATDWDEHVLRDTHYKETFTGGDMLGFG
ncbi:MAG TPA: omptin family outer membrane protease, partial [Kiritimatiellia bacterium]|nr:omptin family outer membrane protease [Kiritimatiellia bacterium]